MKAPQGEISRYTWFDISIKEDKALQCKMKHMKECQHCYLSIKLVLLKGWGEGPQGLSYQLLMLNWVSILKSGLRKEITGHCLLTHDWYHRLKNSKESDSLLIFCGFGYTLSCCKSAQPIGVSGVMPSLTSCEVHPEKIYIYEKEKLIEIKANESEGPLIPPKPEAKIPLSGEKKVSCLHWWVEQELPFLLQTKLAMNQTLI